MIPQLDLTTDFTMLLPEAALAAGIVLILAIDMLVPKDKRGIGAYIGVAACLVGAWIAATALPGNVGQMLAIDGISRLARPAILLFTALILIAGAKQHGDKEDGGAWAAAVTGLGLGAILAAAAQNLIALWIGLELVSLASYPLAAWRGGDRKAAEAGMKYVLFGGVASALVLFGMSHVYGLTGHLDFAGIGAALTTGMPLPALAALCLAGTGIAYKLTLVPFHFYAPDVYQGAPAITVAAVGVAPKIAAIAALVRGLQMALPATFVAPTSLGYGLTAVAVVSMLLAAFTALAQRDAKRIIAFSGIGHAGSILLALACLSGPQGIAAAGFYLVAYGLANTGALVCLSVIERERGSCSLDALAGSMKSRPWLTTALCLFLFSLAGVPPLAGFLAKWGVLQQALAAGSIAGQGHLTIAALLLLLSTAVSAWAYLLIVRAAVLQPAAAGSDAPRGPLPLGVQLVLLVCALGTFAAGLWLDGFGAIGRIVAP